MHIAIPLQVLFIRGTPFGIQQVFEVPKVAAFVNLKWACRICICRKGALSEKELFCNGELKRTYGKIHTRMASQHNSPAPSSLPWICDCLTLSELWYFEGNGKNTHCIILTGSDNMQGMPKWTYIDIPPLCKLIIVLYINWSMIGIILKVFLAYISFNLDLESWLKSNDQNQF